MKKTFTSCAVALLLAMAAPGASAQILIGQPADLPGPVAASVK